MSLVPDMETVASASTTSQPAALNESLTLLLSNSAEELLNNGMSVVVTTTSEAIFLLLVFVASAVSNCLVFVIFYHRPHLRSLSNRFVLNLALCDLLYTVLVLPHVMACLLTGGLGAGLWWCRLTKTLGALLALACSFAVLLIALDRYCAVMNPLHYGTTVTRGRSSLMIAGVWTAAFTLVALPFAVLGFAESPHDRPFRAPSCGCWSTATTLVAQPYRLWYALVVSGAGFAIPLGVLLWIYACMYRAARESSVRARRHSITTQPSDVNLPEVAARAQPPGGSISSGECTPVMCSNHAHHALMPAPNSSSTFRKSFPHSSATNRRRSSAANAGVSTFFREEGRAAQTGVLVVISFVCCWFPFWAFVALEARPDWRPAPAQLGRTLAQHLTFLGCALNPFVYVYRNRMVWKDVRQAVHCRRRRMLQRRSCLPPKSPLAGTHVPISMATAASTNGSCSLPCSINNNHAGGGGSSCRQNKEIVWFRNGTIRQASRTLLKVALQEESDSVVQFRALDSKDEFRADSNIELTEQADGSMVADESTTLLATSNHDKTDGPEASAEPEVASSELSRAVSVTSNDSQCAFHDRGDTKHDVDDEQADDEVDIADDVFESEDGDDDDDNDEEVSTGFHQSTATFSHIDNRNDDVIRAVVDDDKEEEHYGLPPRCHSDTWSTGWTPSGWSANKVRSANNVVNANHANCNHQVYRLALPLPAGSATSQPNNNNNETNVATSAPWSSCSLDYYCQYDNRSSSAASVLRVTQSSQSYPGTTL